MEYVVDLTIDLVELNEPQLMGMQMRYKGSHLIYFLETYYGSGSGGNRCHKRLAYSLNK